MKKADSAELPPTAEDSGAGAFEQFAQVIGRKRPLLFLLGFFTFVFLLLKLATWYSKALSVFEFAFIATLIGLAPAFFFRKVFKFENIIGWLTNAAVFGLLLIPFLFLIFGWTGINQVFAHSVPFLYFCSLAGIISLLIFADDESVAEVISFRKLVRVDLLMYAILIFYTAVLTLQNFSQVFTSWDAFTFWGLASKYIYQFHRLPDATFDVLSHFKYSAFYPIYYSTIYDLYGSIVEQYATWVNVFINFLAITLVYNRMHGRSLLEKSLAVALLIIASYSAINALYMLSMYADILCAFILLLYMLVLTNPAEVTLQTFSKRAFLILLLASALFFVKSPFLVLTLALILTWIVYDFRFILQERNSLLRRWDVWTAFLGIGLLFFMHFSYMKTHLDVQDQMAYDDLIDPVLTSVSATLDYARKLAGYLTKNNPYLLALWLFGLCLPLLASKRRSVSRQYVFTNLILLGIFLFYCLAYILNQRSLSSGSLVRYTGLIVYLLPLMVTFVPLQVSQKMTLPLVLILLLITGYFIQQSIPSAIWNKNIRLSTGAYSVALEKYSALADNILSVTGEQAKIIIADEIKGLSFTNMDAPAIYIRYFLMTNSVGGQFLGLSKDEMIERAMASDADYLLLLSYKDTFKNCPALFEKGHTYLIKFDGPIDQNANECPFTKDAIVDYENQGK